MEIDPYSPCPCGSGKKLKWCCQSLGPDIERIQRLREAGQQAAALRAVETLSQKEPDNPWVLLTRVELLWADQQYDEARATLDRLLTAHPDHPKGLVLRAWSVLREEGVQPGLGPVQDAIEQVGERAPEVLAALLSAVGDSLLVRGAMLAARRHFQLTCELDPKNEVAAHAVEELDSDPRILTLLKEDYSLKEPTGASSGSQSGFREAVHWSERGAWRAAAERLEHLTDQFPNSKSLWYNLGLCRAWLWQDELAAAALRRYVALETGDDAIETEALAQTLHPDGELPRAPLVKISYRVRDVAQLSKALAANRQCLALPVEPSPAQPQQRGMWVLLDRSVSRWQAGMVPDELPRMSATLYLSRSGADGAEGRLDVELLQGPGTAVATEQLKSIAGDVIDEPLAEETLARTVERHPVHAEWLFPPGIPPAERRRMLDEERARFLLEDWLSGEQSRLDGRSPLEAAQDAPHHVILAAALLVLRQKFYWEAAHPAVADVTARLGLPPMEPIDGSERDLETLPLSRLDRVDPSRCRDEGLLAAVRRASRACLYPLLARFAEAVLERSALDRQMDFGLLCASVAAVARAHDDIEAALHWAQRGRQFDAHYQRSLCELWDLQELRLRLQIPGSLALVEQMVQHISTAHPDPETQEALAGLLAQFGLMRTAERAGAGAETEPVEAIPPELIVPGGGERPKLWVPGQEGEQEDRPRIWTPGQP